MIPGCVGYLVNNCEVEETARVPLFRGGRSVLRGQRLGSLLLIEPRLWRQPGDMLETLRAYDVVIKLHKDLVIKSVPSTSLNEL